MMTKKQFISEVAHRIEDYIPAEINVSKIDALEIIKNNNLKLTGLAIKEEGKNIAPNIYLDDYYDEYNGGKDMNDICKDITRQYLLARNKDFDVSPDNIFNPDKLFVQLINREANETLLDETVYEPYLDMAFTVRILHAKDEDGISSSLLKNDQLSFYNMSKEEIISKAKENTKELFPTKIVRISDLISEMMGENISDMQSPEMYVVTNDLMINGAAAILDKEALSNYFGDRQMTVLPSSIHEFIFIPYDETDEQNCSYMVRDVNQNTLKQSEYLSNSIYRYDGDAKELNIEIPGKESYVEDEYER